VLHDTDILSVLNRLSVKIIMSGNEILPATLMENNDNSIQCKIGLGTASGGSRNSVRGGPERGIEM